MSYCPNCGNQIDTDSYFCPFCGTATDRPVPPERPVGPPTYPYPYTPPTWPLERERVNVGETLSSSWGIITKRPIIILPHLISAIVGTLLGLGAAVSLLAFLLGLGTEFAPLALLAFIAVFVISTTVGGMYPLLTKQVLDGEELDLGGTARRALGRFFSLLGTSLLVAIIAIVPLLIAFVLAFLIPVLVILILIGLIFVLYVMIWYYCAIPALMLEDRGIIDALSASKAFSEGRKWAIFGLILIMFVISFILSIIVAFVPGIVGVVFGFIIGLILTVLNSVLPSYLYIRYGGPGVAPPPPTPVTPAPISPMPKAKEICPTCGAEIDPGQSFCGWCGSKLP